MKFSLTSKLKYSLGAALLLLSFVLYIYGISAPILRIKGELTNKEYGAISAFFHSLSVTCKEGFPEVQTKT